MRSLPELDRLSVAEKDDLIRSLFARVQELTAKVAELEGRLAQDSRNSTKPPSSEGYGKPKPKSLGTPGQNPTGCRRGMKGIPPRRPSVPTTSLPTHRRRSAMSAVRGC